MDEKNIFRISDYSDDEPEEMNVKCAKCGKLIYRHATSCEYCGIHFSGDAYEFTHSCETASTRTSSWVRWGWIILVLLITAFMFIIATVGI